MGTTDPGPRDHLVTRALERALTDLDAELVDEHSLDAAEAPDRLARHAMAELRVNLDGEDSADAQAERVNAIVRTFAGGDEPDAQVSLPARVLQGIRAGHRSATWCRCHRRRQRRSVRAICSSMPRGSPMSARSCAPSSRPPIPST